MWLPRTIAVTIAALYLRSIHGWTISRRSAISAITAAGSPFLSLSRPAVLAAPADDTTSVPMITTNQFVDTVLRNSASSIRVVEFSGPKSETVRVVLQDDSVFGISDIIESPTDPRSPLKVAAAAKANGIPIRFLNFENLTTKKPVYSNSRVQAAEALEQEKRARMQADEDLRQLELARMNEP